MLPLEEKTLIYWAPNVPGWVPRQSLLTTSLWRGTAANHGSPRGGLPQALRTVKHSLVKLPLNIPWEGTMWKTHIPSFNKFNHEEGHVSKNTGIHSARFTYIRMLDSHIAITWELRITKGKMSLWSTCLWGGALIEWPQLFKSLFLILSSYLPLSLSLSLSANLCNCIYKSHIMWVHFIILFLRMMRLRLREAK